METRSALPSQRSPFFPTAAVLDARFTTVDIAASLPTCGVVLDCMPKKGLCDRLSQVLEHRMNPLDEMTTSLPEPPPKAKEGKGFESTGRRRGPRGRGMVNPMMLAVRPL